MPEEQPGQLGALPHGATAGAHPHRPPEVEVEAEVGQIRLVRPDRGASAARPDRGANLTVLIIEVSGGHVQGLLCGDDVALATETDAVLEPRQSGCPRRLLVHGDVSAAILKTRLSQVLGATTPEIAERIALRGRGRDFDSRDLGRGSPIINHDDPRWEWKLEQHKRMRAVRARASELGWTLETMGAGNSDPVA